MYTALRGMKVIHNAKYRKYTTLQNTPLRYTYINRGRDSRHEEYITVKRIILISISGFPSGKFLVPSDMNNFLKSPKLPGNAHQSLKGLDRNISCVTMHSNFSLPFLGKNNNAANNIRVFWKFPN